MQGIDHSFIVTSEAQALAIQAVLDERGRQDQKFPGQVLDRDGWACVLREEMAELEIELAEMYWHPPLSPERLERIDNARKELVQVCASALRWIEADMFLPHVMDDGVVS